MASPVSINANLHNKLTIPYHAKNIDLKFETIDFNKLFDFIRHKELESHIKETKNRLYETGLFTYGIVLVFSESGKIHILNSPNDTNLTHLPKNGEEKDDMGSEP